MAKAGIYPEEGSMGGLPAILKFPGGDQPRFFCRFNGQMKAFRFQVGGMTLPCLCLPTPMSVAHFPRIYVLHASVSFGNFNKRQKSE